MQVKQLAEGHVDINLVESFGVIDSQKVGVGTTLGLSKDELHQIHQTMSSGAVFSCHTGFGPGVLVCPASSICRKKSHRCY